MASDPALVLPLALHWRKGSATTRCLIPGWTAISGYWRQRGGIEQRRESNLRNHSNDDQCSVLAQCPSLAQPYARWYFPLSRVSALPTQRGDRYLSAEVRQGERRPMRRLLHWRKKESTFSASAAMLAATAHCRGTSASVYFWSSSGCSGFSKNCPCSVSACPRKQVAVSGRS